MRCFPRLRIGVGRPVVVDYKQIDWVLGHFSKEERGVMDEVIPRAAEAIEAVLRDGIDRAMNVYNADDEGQEAEGEKQKAEDGKRKSEDGRQKADGSEQTTISGEKPDGLRSAIRRLLSNQERTG